MKVTDETLLDLIDEVSDLIKEAGTPENAALVLLACHAINYELNANKKVDIDEYLDLYCEQFKGFFEEMERKVQ